MSMVVQSIIFYKDGFTKEKAINWLKKNDKKYDIDEKEQTYRSRQITPSKFDKTTFRIKQITKNIDFVLGKLK